VRALKLLRPPLPPPPSRPTACHPVASWALCRVRSIYTKPKSQVPDYSAPVVLRTGDRTIEDFCNRIHKGILKQLKYSWVWGRS